MALRHLKLLAFVGLSLSLFPAIVHAQIEPLAIDLNEPDIEKAWANFADAQEKSLTLVKAQDQFADEPGIDG